MAKILVTGGAGFIGSALAGKLLENPENFVVVVDNLGSGDIRKLPKAINGNFKFIKCDVNLREGISEIMTTFHFDYVFHFAALVGVLNTLKNPVKVLADLDGFKNILDLAKNTGVKRVYFSSSSEVYGEPVELPQNEETTPLNSRLPYAIVKNAGEAFLKSYYQEFGLEYTIFRFFNTYGPKQSKDFVISKFMQAALENKNITIYGNGLQTRTFCYITDNIEACVNTFYKNKFVNDVLNIGNDVETTIIDLAELVIKVTKSSSKIKFINPLKEGDMTRRQPDLVKMKKVFPKKHITLEEGLQKVLEKGLFELKNYK
jgi:UDP-glucose 4-epimerase